MCFIVNLNHSCFIPESDDDSCRRESSVREPSSKRRHSTTSPKRRSSKKNGSLESDRHKREGKAGKKLSEKMGKLKNGHSPETCRENESEKEMVDDLLEKIEASSSASHLEDSKTDRKHVGKEDVTSKKKRRSSHSPGCESRRSGGESLNGSRDKRQEKTEHKGRRDSSGSSRHSRGRRRKRQQGSQSDSPTNTTQSHSQSLSRSRSRSKSWSRSRSHSRPRSYRYKDYHWNRGGRGRDIGEGDLERSPMPCRHYLSGQLGDECVCVGVGSGCGLQEQSRVCVHGAYHLCNCVCVCA